MATSEMPVATAVATRAGGYSAVAASEEAALVAEGTMAAEEIGLGAQPAGAETGALLSAELGPLAIIGGAIGAGVGLLTAALTRG